MKHTKPYILDRALKLFNKNGFINVRLQHIADAGCISVGHLAYHFKHKDCIVENLYDNLKAELESLLYEFPTVHLFEDLNRELLALFQIQKKYIFFYIDTVEVLRAHPTIKDKHQQQIAWQIKQIEWMFEANIFRGSFLQPATENQYKKLAWMFWSMIHNWMYARYVSGMDYLNEDEFLQDIWDVVLPFITEDALGELNVVRPNSSPLYLLK